MLEKFFGDEAEILHETNFQLLLLATVTGPLGPSLLSPILSTLADAFAVSTAKIGLLLSIYTAPAIIIIPLAGIIADRYGRKLVLTTGILLFGLAGTAMAFTTDFRVILLLRLIQGVGGAGIVPVIITAIGDLYSNDQETTAQGLRFSVSGLTQAIFPLLAGVLVVTAWQYPILLHAISFPIAGLIYAFLEEPTRSNQSKEAGDHSENKNSNTLSKMVTILSLFRYRRIFAMTAARGLPPLLYFGFLAYISIIVSRGIGGTPAEAGLLVALASVVMAISASQSGRVTAFFGNKTFPLVMTNVCMIIGISIIAFSPSIQLTTLGTVFLGVGFGLVLSLYRSIITSMVDTRHRGSLVSITESVGRIGSTSGPILLGALVALLEPSLGLILAVRWAAFTAGAIGGGGGILFVLLYSISPSLELASDHMQ